ncbi:MAG: hypothetical protein AAF922_11545 [Pseudomonadota bacterium]
MQLIQENETFEAAAREMTIRFIEAVAMCLHRSKDVAFDLADPEAVYSDLLWEVCFKAMIELEEQSGMDVEGDRYTPRVAFNTSRDAPSSAVIIGNAAVHGMVDDPQISHAVERARQRLEITS